MRGVRHPKAKASKGRMPALGDAQARQLLDAPQATP